MNWLMIGAVLGSVVFVALVWIFVGDGPDEPAGHSSDHPPDPGWRARKAEATSYWEMAEYRDSIEDGPRDGPRSS